MALFTKLQERLAAKCQEAPHIPLYVLAKDVIGGENNPAAQDISSTITIPALVAYLQANDIEWSHNVTNVWPKLVEARIACFAWVESLVSTSAVQDIVNVEDDVQLEALLDSIVGNMAKRARITPMCYGIVGLDVSMLLLEPNHVGDLQEPFLAFSFMFICDDPELETAEMCAVREAYIAANMNPLIYDPDLDDDFATYSDIT